MFAAAAMFAAGCGHGAERSGDPAAPGSPQQVAVAYSQALLAGRIDDARRYVAPASQPAFAIVASQLGQAGDTSQNLAAGSATIRGTNAVVVLTGTLCHAGRCVSNTSPTNTNPIFTVLEASVDGHWMVSFDGAGAPAPGTSSSGPHLTAPAHP
jgi:hypothetical protein